MFKFNNTNIFTGYLKQVLSSFHLPKCQIYTKEQAQYAANYYSKIENLKADLQTEIHRTAAAKAQLEAEITKIKALQELENAPSYLTEIEAQYVEELNKINAPIVALQSKITAASTEPKELNVISTNYHSVYDVYPGAINEDAIPSYQGNMRYVPYIKDGFLQIYTKDKWHNYHAALDNEHLKAHKSNTEYTKTRYFYGQKILNYTKNLKIQNTVYDSYTHEYLGDYLRFHRDFANINLMPLYNCFSNRACPHLDLSFAVNNNYTAVFKTDQSFEDSLYKYYMVPVKFFKDYTIAIDSSASIELCCCIYDEYYNKDSDFSSVPKLTYQCFSDLQFKTPVLYTKLQNLNSLLLESENSDLCQHEADLKLILKVPLNNTSSIVILEGDYTKYNDSVAISTDIENESYIRDLKELKSTNKTVINYEYLEACDLLADKLITPLQLLRANTGESYPFADRLVEYLVGNAITVNEEILDNVVRAKTIISDSCNPNVINIEAADGIWEPALQCIVYDYINNNQNVEDINHDILGYIDKDVEKWFTVKYYKRDKYGSLELDKDNKPIIAAIETMANVDIYKD